MARNQFLINYHTSGNVKPVEEVKLGEIVVQHNNEEPKLIIKKTDGTWAEFVDSNEVVKIVSGITNPIELRVIELEGEFEALSAATTAISGTYATKVVAQGYADAAKTAAIASASAYTDTQVNALSGDVDTKFDEVESDINELSAATTAISNTYATKVEAQGYADAAKTAAIASASAYTDTQVNALSGDVDTKFDEVESDINELSAATRAISKTYATKGVAEAYASEAKAAAIALASAYTDTQVNALSGDVDTKFAEVEGTIGELSGATEKAISAITETISKAYVYKGSVENKENLPASGNVGDVYNVVNGSGVLGEADYIPAGTNYAWDGEKWDALGGIVDLTNYITSADLKTVKDNVEEIDANLKALSAATTAISNTYATKVEAQGYADAAKTAAIASASAYTDTQVNALSGAVNTKFAEVEGDIDELQSFSGKVATEYATKAYAEAEADAAQAAAIASANEHTDEQIGALSVAVNTKFADVEGDIEALSAVTTAIPITYATKSYVDSNVNGAMRVAINTANEHTDEQIGALSVAVNTKFADVEGDIEALSGVTGTAVQGVTVSGIEGVSTGKTEGNIVNLDFTKVVIDCGNF